MKNRIQELRRTGRIRQEDLAEAVGVTRQTIISLENGRYNASLGLAHKIARYFGRTIEEIFIFEEHSFNHPYRSRRSRLHHASA